MEPMTATGMFGEIIDFADLSLAPPSAFRMVEAPVRPDRIPGRGLIRLFEDEPFVLESGRTLSPVEVRFETWGHLSPQADNVVMVCHALTGNAHVAAHSPKDQPGWWEAFVGREKAIDTDAFFVISTNVIGSTGSTGPETPRPDGTPWGLDFPWITVRDMVRVQQAALEALGISSVALVIGGSLGGMQALEWAALFPDQVGAAAVIGATPSFSPMGIALNEVQRRAVLLGLRHGEGSEGLAIARGLGMLSYRSSKQLSARFGRKLQAGHSFFEPGLGLRFAVESYLDYQGERFIQRFSPETYIILSRAMDFHDLRRGRPRPFPNGAPKLFLAGLQEDWLFLPEEIEAFAKQLRADGVDDTYRLIENPVGHDAFLIDSEPMRQWIWATARAALRRKAS